MFFGILKNLNYWGKENQDFGLSNQLYQEKTKKKEKKIREEW